ncbi:hypothetical protein BHJ80_08820 [Escherichia coli]|nr:hypothetical protein BHJ80_08820 [Escherichia coli]
MEDESSSQRETLTDAVHYPVQCCPHRAAESWKPSCRRVPEDRHRLKKPGAADAVGPFGLATASVRRATMALVGRVGGWADDGPLT